MHQILKAISIQNRRGSRDEVAIRASRNWPGKRRVVPNTSWTGQQSISDLTVEQILRRIKERGGGEL